MFTSVVPGLRSCFAAYLLGNGDRLDKIGVQAIAELYNSSSNLVKGDAFTAPI